VSGSIGSVGTGGISSGSFAADAINAAALASDAGTEIGTAVWATTTRELTSGANIALAKGTGVTGLNDLDAAGVRSAVGLASANLDTQIGTLATASNLATVAGDLDTEIASIKAATDKLNDTLENDAGTYRFTANALEQAPSGTGASAASIVAAMFTVDTGETEADAVAGSVVYEIVQNSGGGGGGLDAAGVRAAIGMASANLDTQLAAIVTDTAEIGTAGAGLTALASAANLATLASYVDTEVAAIKVKTDNLPASPAAAGDIPSAAAIADAVWDEALSGHLTSGSTGLAVRDTDLRGARTVVRGTVGSGGSSTTQFTPSALSPAGSAADQFKGRIIVWDNDTATAALRGQATDITASSAAALPLLTFTALTTAPSSGDSFSIV
jgi:hypothetical protein